MINSMMIRVIIEESVVGFDVNALEDEMSFQEAGIDSLDHANILFTIEDQFKVKIPNEAVDICSSIKGIVEYLINNK